MHVAIMLPNCSVWKSATVCSCATAMYIICLAFIGEVLTIQFNQHSIGILDESGGLFIYLRPQSRQHHNICSPHQRSFPPKKKSYGLTINIQSHLTTARVRICLTCDFTLLALLWPRLLLELRHIENFTFLAIAIANTQGSFINRLS